MKNRVFAFLLILALLCAALPLTAAAAGSETIQIRDGSDILTLGIQDCGLSEDRTSYHVVVDGYNILFSGKEGSFLDNMPFRTAIAWKMNKEQEKEMNTMDHENHNHQGGCPGSKMMQFRREEEAEDNSGAVNTFRPVSRLAQWPCQIKLVPTVAPFFDGAKLLIAADCTAYAYANMHEDFMKGKTTIIGCPKLDGVDYTEKLAEIISNNDIKSVTIVRMEVPCCGGLQRAAENALRMSGKFIPWQVVTISRDGRILD